MSQDQHWFGACATSSGLTLAGWWPAGDAHGPRRGPGRRTAARGAPPAPVHARRRTGPAAGSWARAPVVAAAGWRGASGSGWTGGSHRGAGGPGPDQCGQLGDRVVGHLSRSFLLLLVARVSNTAESFPCTSITALAVSSSAVSRSFSRRNRAASRCSVVTGCAPEAPPNASKAPLSRCSRQALISEVYRPSRRSNAPRPTRSQARTPPARPACTSPGTSDAGPARAPAGQERPAQPQRAPRPALLSSSSHSTRTSFPPSKTLIRTVLVPHPRLTGRVHALRRDSAAPDPSSGGPIAADGPT